MSEAVGTPESGGAKEQERFLPIANIGRIMRRGVPENGKIAKDAKESIQECVSEFISFITSEASDKCMKEKRKTINGDDLIWSMGTLGFEDYVEPLKLYLKLYREGDTSKGSKSEQAGKKEVALNGQPGSSVRKTAVFRPCKVLTEEDNAAADVATCVVLRKFDTFCQVTF
uniref:Nuclear transcription factor Y subunit B-4 n=1 Tax=Aegilops tauschii TaxID=37682 RepID=M8BZH0_AEGTA